MDTEIDKEGLSFENRYGTIFQTNVTKRGPCLVIGEQGSRLPGGHQRVPVEVHRYDYGTLSVELNFSEQAEPFRLLGCPSEPKSQPHQNRLCHLVGVRSNEQIDVAIGAQT